MKLESQSAVKPSGPGNSSLAHRLLRGAAQFSAGQFIAMSASIARIAITARFLSKGENGTWLAMQLVLGYAANLHLGSLFGLFRSYPLLMAKGDSVAAAREQQTGFSFTALMALLAFPIVYLVLRRMCPGISPLTVAGAGALASLTLVRSYFNTMFKAQSRFRDLATGMTWGAISSLLATALIVKLGLAGALIATGAQGLIEVLYLWRLGRPPILRLSLPALRLQIQVGAMTLLTSLGLLLLTTIDRTVMIQRLGADATGAYYIGANIMVLMPVVAAMPAAVLTPQFFERVGRGESVMSLVERPIQLAGLGFAALIAMGSVTVAPVIAILWPQLASGSLAAHAALFATYPLVLAGLVSNVYYAHNRQIVHVGILVVAAAASFALAQLGVSLTHSIAGAAAGAAAGLYLYFPASAIGAFYVLGNVRAGLSTVTHSIFPILYAGAMAAGTELAMLRMFPHSPVLRGTAGLAAVGLLMLPLLFRIRSLMRAGLKGR